MSQNRAKPHFVSWLAMWSAKDYLPITILRICWPIYKWYYFVGFWLMILGINEKHCSERYFSCCLSLFNLFDIPKTILKCISKHNLIQIKISKYTLGFKSYEPFADWSQQAALMLSKPSSIKKSCYSCQWLENVDMNMYAKFWSKYTMWFNSYKHFH